MYALIGAMLIFFFSSLTIKAVGSTAAVMIREIRRQFKEIPGITEGAGKPDYSRCIDISTKAALRNMVYPSLLVVIGLMIVGVVPGPETAGGLLMVETMVGVLMALFMNNVGATMDNAKKYIKPVTLAAKAPRSMRPL